jgi:hypothetical protein
MNKNELWKLVKENNGSPKKALGFYMEYRRCGGKRIIRAYEEFYQRMGTK